MARDLGAARKSYSKNFCEYVAGEAVPKVLDVPWPPTKELGPDAESSEKPGRIKPLQTIPDEAALAAVAVALGAMEVRGVSSVEKAIAEAALPVAPQFLRVLREQIREGQDPLGVRFCQLRDAVERRKSGAVYTPPVIVRAMLSWAETVGAPQRVVEPGAGSGRFVMEAGRLFRDAELVAVEIDPLAALTSRANLTASGMADRSQVELRDFRTLDLSEIDGRTLYIGNPPYVRHHLIEPEWKAWLKREAGIMSLKASALAGLHVHFFLAIARRARAGDYGVLITAAEWLDVNYGQLVRDLFLDCLGGQAVYVVEPKAEAFPGTATTCAVTTFTVNGKPPSARFGRVSKLTDLDDLTGGSRVRRERLETENRWSHFTRKPRPVPEDYVELGELCRVHRGQVTGANRVWTAGEHSTELPDEVLFRTVTRAMDLICAGWALVDASALRQVIDLPVDLSVFTGTTRKSVDRFLRSTERMGARESYVARHRKAWWSVGLREPAPILATYMARRPPTFVRNRVEARHINIAHGLYPREVLSEAVINGLVTYLRRSASLQGGRVYAGGLTKFEPREMERIPIPEPEILAQMEK